MTQAKGPAIMAGPTLCPGSGEWVGWGWSWYPCPECRARVDVDQNTLAILPHAIFQNVDTGLAWPLAPDAAGDSPPSG
jgi:hypothetical protein